MSLFPRTNSSNPLKTLVNPSKQPPNFPIPKAYKFGSGKNQNEPCPLCTMWICMGSMMVMHLWGSLFWHRKTNNLKVMSCVHTASYLHCTFTKHSIGRRSRPSRTQVPSRPQSVLLRTSNHRASDRLRASDGLRQRIGLHDGALVQDHIHLRVGQAPIVRVSVVGQAW